MYNKYRNDPREKYLVKINKSVVIPSSDDLNFENEDGHDQEKGAKDKVGMMKLQKDPDVHSQGISKIERGKKKKYRNNP